VQPQNLHLPQQKLHLLAPQPDALAFGQWQTAHRQADRGARALIGSPLRYLGLIACVEALNAFHPRNDARACNGRPQSTAQRNRAPLLVLAGLPHYGESTCAA
jgi:hypothetical protein